MWPFRRRRTYAELCAALRRERIHAALRSWVSRKFPVVARSAEEVAGTMIRHHLHGGMSLVDASLEASGMLERAGFDSHEARRAVLLSGGYFAPNDYYAESIR